MDKGWLLAEFERAKQRQAAVPEHARPKIVKGSLMGKVIADDLKEFHDKQRLIEETRGPVIPGCPICGAGMLNPVKHGEWHLELEEQVKWMKNLRGKFL